MIIRNLDKSKYYYLIVGKILWTVDKIYHFVYYHGVHQLIHLITGKWVFRSQLRFRGYTDFEYLSIYKAMNDHDALETLHELNNYDKFKN